MKTITAAAIIIFAATTAAADAAAVCFNSPKGKKCVNVSPRAAPKFQALIDWLESKGYRIKFARGNGRGSVRRSLHPSGMALDINQTHRSRVTAKFPEGTTEKARELGIFHGSLWCSRDTGHFQIGGFDSTCKRRRR